MHISLAVYLSMYASILISHPGSQNGNCVLPVFSEETVSIQEGQHCLNVQIAHIWLSEQDSLNPGYTCHMEKFPVLPVLLGALHIYYKERRKEGRFRSQHGYIVNVIWGFGPEATSNCLVQSVICLSQARMHGCQRASCCLLLCHFLCSALLCSEVIFLDYMLWTDKVKT